MSIVDVINRLEVALSTECMGDTKVLNNYGFYDLTLSEQIILFNLYREMINVHKVSYEMFINCRLTRRLGELIRYTYEGYDTVTSNNYADSTHYRHWKMLNIDISYNYGTVDSRTTVDLLTTVDKFRIVGRGCCSFCKKHGVLANCNICDRPVCKTCRHSRYVAKQHRSHSRNIYTCGYCVDIDCIQLKESIQLEEITRLLKDKLIVYNPFELVQLLTKLRKHPQCINCTEIIPMVSPVTCVNQLVFERKGCTNRNEPYRIDNIGPSHYRCKSTNLVML